MVGNDGEDLERSPGEVARAFGGEELPDSLLVRRMRRELQSLPIFDEDDPPLPVFGLELAQGDLNR